MKEMMVVEKIVVQRRLGSVLSALSSLGLSMAWRMDMEMDGTTTTITIV
jgi:hypothetical protein